MRAKELAEKLSKERDDFNYRYIDIHAEGITKADLEKTVGKPVETVPQIFVDQKHIGGCTDFEAWAKENLNLFAWLLWQRPLPEGAIGVFFAGG